MKLSWLNVTARTAPLVFGVMTVAALVIAVLSYVRYADPHGTRWTVLWIDLPCMVLIFLGFDISMFSSAALRRAEPDRAGLASAGRLGIIFAVLGFGGMLVLLALEWNADPSQYAALVTATGLGFYVAALGHLALVRRFG